MRGEEKGRHEGDRVTRRGGTKLFSRSDTRSTDRVSAFDVDREEMDTDVRRRSRDGEEFAARRREADYGYTRRDYDDDARDGYRDGYRDSYREERYRGYRDEERYERRPRYGDERYDRRRDEEEERYERRRGYDEERDGYRRSTRRVEPAPRRSVQKVATKRVENESFFHQVVPYVMFWVALFAAVSFVLRDIAGLSEGAGVIGNWFADFLNGLFGIAAYFLPFEMLVLSLKWKRLLREDRLVRKLLLSTSFLLLFSAIIHVFQDRADLANLVTNSDTLFHNGVMRQGGGLFGGFVGEWLGRGLRMPGTCLLAIPLLIILGIYMVGLTPSGLWQRLNAKISMMRRQGREERGARGVERMDADARTRAERGADGGWRQPQPLSAGAYDFHEDEPDVPVTPTRSATRGVEEMDAGDISRRAASAFGGYRADPVHEILDIPDDEPEMAPPSEGARTILEGAGHSADSAGQTMADILRDLAEPTATPEEPAPVAEPVVTAPASPQVTPVATTPAEKRGEYYSPFALPIRPEPRREKRVESVVSQTPEVTVAPVAETTAPEIAEESLGSVRTTPYVPPVVTTPVSHTPIYRNPAEAYRADTTVRETPATETPATAPVVDDTPVPYVETVTTRIGGEAIPTPESLFDFDGVEEEETTEVDVPTVATPVSTTRPTASVFDRNPFAMPEEEDETEADVVTEDVSYESVSVASIPVQPVMPAEPVAPVAPTPVTPVSPATSVETVAPVTPTEPAVTRESVVDERPAYVPPVQPAPTPAPAPAVRVEPVKPETPPAPVPVPRRPYTRPHVGLLAVDQNVRTSDFYEEIEDTKQILRDTLESFNIHIQDRIEYSHGPSVTRYELRPVAGTSVRSVTNRIEDISLNLASAVRIEAPIPGKPAIGIEVPNKVRETVYMRTMLESDEYRLSTKPLEVPLGLDVGGAVRMCNLAAMPHLLIAGTTGSGKSVCINAILLSLIFKTSPDDLRLILIDPKQIEFAPYEHVPHLYMPIVTDMQRAAGALACAVQEMERRFSLIRDVGVRNIEAYNEAVKNDPDREHLPYIIIVIDEFADLKMSVANNDPENFTCRIAQKARAAGIHLIIGTQRPSVDVITGKLKTNIPSRIAFMVKQQVDSRTILDINGAESLTGRGDMLYMASNSSDKAPVRVQGAYVSDKELEDVIGYVRSHNDPVQYNQAFMDQIEVEMARAQSGGKKSDAEDFGDMESDDGEDPKFIEAVKLAVETQKVATSLLQRRIGVGYGRAAKIIDRMEELGLVSAAEGNKPRQILPAAQGYLNHIAAGGGMAVEDDTTDGFDDYIG